MQRLFPSYTVSWSAVFRLVRIRVRGLRDFYYWLAPVSRADTPGEVDRIVGWTDPVSEDLPDGGLRLSFSAASSVWQQRETILEFHPDRIESWIRLNGRGKLDRLHWFCGVVDDVAVGSMPGWDRYMPGCPNFLGRKDFAPNEAYSIGVGHEQTHFWGQALNSGPLFYSFHNDSAPGCIAAGIVALPGQNTFDAFDFNHRPADFEDAPDSILGTQSFSLSYFGRVAVGGEWESPHLVFLFGEDHQDCLKSYCGLLEARSAVSKAVQERGPEWWYRPIFCTWHEQCALSYRQSGGSHTQREELETFTNTKDLATQANCERWLEIILRERLSIGTYLIDARWQTQEATNQVDPAKWPDLHGFIKRCHGHGIRVILWLNAWVADGLPADECILRDSVPVAADPTNPAYAKRLRESIYDMLSPSALDADGFKIDGTLFIPMGPGLVTHGGVYGYELQRELLKIYWEASMEAKPDAVVSLFTANPYFRDLSNYVRLGDLYSVYGRPDVTMRERAQLFEIAMPGKPIDTDGTFRFSMAEDSLEEWDIQLELGVPTIYEIENHLHLRGFHPGVVRPFEAEEYERLRESLNNYCTALELGKQA